MTRRYGVIHAVVECEDCDWVAKNYKNAQANASVHARKYQHKVSGDIGIAIEYNGRSA